MKTQLEFQGVYLILIQGRYSGPAVGSAHSPTTQISWTIRTCWRNTLQGTWLTEPPNSSLSELFYIRNEDSGTHHNKGGIVDFDEMLD